MSFWTFCKICIGLVVFAVMGFSGMLAWHVLVKPQGGIFEKIVPQPVTVVGKPKEEPAKPEPARKEIPMIDPGEKSYEKAREWLAMGRTAEAREKLLNIISTYPGSVKAPVARKIIGEMNLDEILSTAPAGGKKTITVRRGDSFFGIAGKNQTTIEMLEYLNAIEDARGLQPGQEFLVMPLNFRIEIDTKAETVSLWNGSEFVCEWQARDISNVPKVSKPTKISSKSAQIDGKKITPFAKEYRYAEKLAQITAPPVVIRAWDGAAEKPASGVLMKPEDMEEFNLLTRPGNEVLIK